LEYYAPIPWNLISNQIELGKSEIDISKNKIHRKMLLSSKSKGVLSPQAMGEISV